LSDYRICLSRAFRFRKFQGNEFDAALNSKVSGIADYRGHVVARCESAHHWQNWQMLFNRPRIRALRNRDCESAAQTRRKL